MTSRSNAQLEIREQLPNGTCSREDLEVALKQGLGYRWSVVGPFEHADLAGVETHAGTLALLFPLLANDTTPPSQFADPVAQGRLGVKSGAGVYEDGPGEAGTPRSACCAVPAARPALSSRHAFPAIALDSGS